MINTSFAFLPPDTLNRTSKRTKGDSKPSEVRVALTNTNDPPQKAVKFYELRRNEKGQLSLELRENYTAIKEVLEKEGLKGNELKEMLSEIQFLREDLNRSIRGLKQREIPLKDIPKSDELLLPNGSHNYLNNLSQLAFFLESGKEGWRHPLKIFDIDQPAFNHGQPPVYKLTDGLGFVEGSLTRKSYKDQKTGEEKEGVFFKISTPRTADAEAGESGTFIPLDKLPLIIINGNKEVIFIGVEQPAKEPKKEEQGTQRRLAAA